MNLLRTTFMFIVVASSPSCDVINSDAGSTGINEVPLPSDRPSFSLSLASPADERIEVTFTWYPKCPYVSFVEFNQRGEVASTTLWELTPEPFPIPLPSGYSANLYRDGVIQSIGPADASHTHPIGRQDSYVKDQNESGHIVGSSLQFSSDGSVYGHSAWLYDAGTVRIIGLFDSEHTRIDGSQWNYSRLLNEAGQVAGTASRNDQQGEGESAWFYSDGITHRIGLVDDYHTSIEGEKRSWVASINDVGQALGGSYNYAQDPETGYEIDGYSCWLYSDGVTRNIGLVDSLHTGPGGIRRSVSADKINSAGDVLGYSSQYDSAGERLGDTLWIYSEGEYEYLPAGFAPTTMKLNNAGQVVGKVSIDVPELEQSSSAVWLYSDGNIETIGLYDAEHTGAYGVYYSGVGYPFGFSCGGRWDSLNEAGHVIGRSQRFDVSGTALGESVWLYRDGVTRKIGLIDNTHTRSTDGYRRSISDQLNNDGHVAGYSVRFNSTLNPAQENGHSAWLYDSATDQLFDLTLSVGADGYALSSVSWLTESGVALGVYQLFAESGADMGQRLFYFDTEYGLFDLAELVLRGRKDWDSLLSVVAANEQGQIVVTGTLTNSSNPVYFLLTPVFP